MALGGKDVLRLVIDADSSGATKEFDKLGRNIKSTVGDVEKTATGLKGKLGNLFEGLAGKSSGFQSALDKVGISGKEAGAAIGAAIPVAAIGAGAAITAFAAKSIGEFQSLATEVLKFKEATGLSAEEASKFVSAADDIGISVDKIQTAFVMFEKQLGGNRGSLKEFGIELVHAKDGSVDMTATMLNAVDAINAIHDPTQKAALEAKLFGRSYADVAEFITQGSAKIKAGLESTSQSQIFTDAELQKAKLYRAALDHFGDSVKDLELDIGGALVPALTDATNTAASFIAVFENTKTFDKQHGGFLGDLLTSAKETLNPLDGLRNKWHEIQDAFGSDDGGKKAADSLDVLAKSASDLGASIGPAGNSFDDFARTAKPAADINLQFGGSADAVAENLGHESDALKAADDALAAHSNATLAAFDATFAVKDAQDQFAKSLLTATQTANDSTKSAGEVSAAYDDETQAAEKVAAAVVEKAKKDAIASGTALTAKQSNDLLIDTLKTQAAQASGPTKKALEDLIGKLQETGQQHPEPTVGLNDQASGPLSTLDAKLNAIDQKAINIGVNVNTETAAGRINRIIDGLNILNQAPGGSSIRFGHIATGTNNWRGGLAMVGERGPELVLLPKGAAVKTAAETKAIMDGPSIAALPSRGAGSGRSYTIVVQGAVVDQIGVGRAVKQAIAAAERAGVN
jgi:hypothetical protein